VRGLGPWPQTRDLNERLARRAKAGQKSLDVSGCSHVGTEQVSSVQWARKTAFSRANE
jgi:hypothetical protein